jgi:ribonuclease HI
MVVNPKPLNWIPTRDIDKYNGDIRAYLGLPPIPEIENKFVYNIYTDGSYHPPGGRHKLGYAGWGFIVYDFGEHVRKDLELFTAFGPVEIRNGTSGFLGATRKTNNTAELHAFIESAIWAYPLETTALRFNVDSLYVIRLLRGEFVARENISISILAQHWWDVLRRKHNCTLVWVKGHSGDIGNERADELAELGCWDSNVNEAYVRMPITFDWDQDTFVEKLSTANHKTQTILEQTANRRRKTVDETRNPQLFDEFYRSIDDLPAHPHDHGYNQDYS